VSLGKLTKLRVKKKKGCVVGSQGDGGAWANIVFLYFPGKSKTIGKGKGLLNERGKEGERKVLKCVAHFE